MRCWCSITGKIKLLFEMFVEMGCDYDLIDSM